MKLILKRYILEVLFIGLLAELALGCYIASKVAKSRAIPVQQLVVKTPCDVDTAQVAKPN